jgi:hypothetical protein
MDSIGTETGVDPIEMYRKIGFGESQSERP